MRRQGILKRPAMAYSKTFSLVVVCNIQQSAPQSWKVISWWVNSVLDVKESVFHTKLMYITYYNGANSEKSSPSSSLPINMTPKNIHSLKISSSNTTGSHVNRRSFRHGPSERTRFLNSAPRAFSIELFPNLLAAYANLVTSYNLASLAASVPSRPRSKRTKICSGETQVCKLSS